MGEHTASSALYCIIYALILGGSSTSAFLSSTTTVHFSFGGELPKSRFSPSPPPSATRPNQCPRGHSTSTDLAMSSPSPTGNLVSIEQAIAAHKAGISETGSKNVFVDGSWHMPPRSARSEYASGPRISGALFLDIDDLGPPPGHPANPDASKKLPHMKPTPKTFAKAMDLMGISPEDTLYVYATKGCMGYCRAYWTLSSCGYHDPERVRLVQGSLDEWKESGGELEREVLADGNDARLFRMVHDDVDGENEIKYSLWKEDRHDSMVVDKEHVTAVVNQFQEGTTEPDAIIVDARSSGRFYGTEPEPRPGLRGGHQPGAINVPFVSLLDPDDITKFRPMEEVKETFVKAGIVPLVEGGGPRRVICTCGSGVTAASLAVGLEECGLRAKEDILIYDGSWIDWGGDKDTLIITTD